jgi:hypothetical protein
MTESNASEPDQDTSPPFPAGPDGRLGLKGAKASIAVVLGVLAVAALGILALKWPPLHRQIMLSISKKQSTYAEIYFSDFPSLPNEVQADHEYRIPFTVVSHGRTPAQVRVSSQVTFDGHTQPLGGEMLRLVAGQPVTATVKFVPPRSVTSYVVEIGLSSGEEIQWRVNAE